LLAETVVKVLESLAERLFRGVVLDLLLRLFSELEEPDFVSMCQVRSCVPSYFVGPDPSDNSHFPFPALSIVSLSPLFSVFDQTGETE
jgi:hypothetical protein